MRGLDDFEPWADRIRHFPEEVVDQAVKRIPPAWLEGDEEALERLLEQNYCAGAGVSGADRELPHGPDGSLPELAVTRR